MSYESNVPPFNGEHDYETCHKASLEAIDENFIAEKLREYLYSSNDCINNCVNLLNDWFNEHIYL